MIGGRWDEGMGEWEQLDIFDMAFPLFRIDKPIRLIELFAGIGSQTMALRDLGAEFESWRISEWEINANRSYKAIHNLNDNTDYSKKFKKFKWLARVLYEYGISADGKTKLTLEEIRNRGERWCRRTYNEFRANHNMGSIANAHALDLQITGTDRFCYIVTYSFPCQDLSVAGRRKGMAKGSGTRSGMLWEVERLLGECHELPQVLLMENVPQVHGKANMPDFQEWLGFLKGKGYSNYWKDLNAKDYGVAQNRDRCFMVSLLGEWNYKFPRPMPLRKKLKDYLEDDVGGGFYILTEKADKLIRELERDGGWQDGNIRGIYTGVPESFQKGLYPVARCVEAGKHDLAVVGMVEQVGNLAGAGNWDNPQRGRVYSGNGLSPAMNGIGGGGSLEPKVVVPMHGRHTQAQYSIRKLTPLECWRLMGFSDGDFHKAEAANSNSQLYKQAGNSIVKDVLMAIFRKMLPEGGK